MKIFLDACAIIYWVELAEPYYSQFANILHQLKKEHKNPVFAASHLSILECRIKPLRDHDENLLKHYQQFFCARDLELIPLNLEIIEKAAELRAFYNLRTPDAIQASSSLSITDGAIFLTADGAFKKIPELNVLIIND